MFPLASDEGQDQMACCTRTADWSVCQSLGAHREQLHDDNSPRTGSDGTAAAVNIHGRGCEALHLESVMVTEDVCWARAGGQILIRVGPGTRCRDRCDKDHNEGSL